MTRTEVDIHARVQFAACSRSSLAGNWTTGQPTPIGELFVQFPLWLSGCGPNRGFTNWTALDTHGDCPVRH